MTFHTVGISVPYRRWVRNSLPTCSGLNWQYVGEAYWSAFQACLYSVIGESGLDGTSTFGNLSGSNKWYGGVLAPNGMIYGIPLNSATVLKINPTNDTVSTFGNLSGTYKWIGGVLAPNGMIYGIPLNSATVLKINPNEIEPFNYHVCLSAYWNKL